MVISFSSTFAQDDVSIYNLKVQEALNLYHAKEYKRSADMYAKAFVVMGRRSLSNDRYNAACSYALSGEKDSAFLHLNLVVKGFKYKNLAHITSDSDLNSLHDEKRWGEIIKMVTANKLEAEKDLNKPLAHLLDSIYEEDQGVREGYKELKSKYGKDSDELKAFWKKVSEVDKRNEVIVTKILDEYGWLGRNVIRERGNSTLFLVIQHAPIKTQKKYLPMMRQAVKDKKASGADLALLEDRVNLRTGKKQIYGSQMGYMPDGTMYVQALEDPENVDKRRAKVGLQPLNSYTQYWNINFDPVEYLKKLTEYEKILKKEYKSSKKVR